VGQATMGTVAEFPFVGEGKDKEKGKEQKMRGNRLLKGKEHG